MPFVYNMSFIELQAKLESARANELSTVLARCREQLSDLEQQYQQQAASYDGSKTHFAIKTGQKFPDECDRLVHQFCSSKGYGYRGYRNERDTLLFDIEHGKARLGCHPPRAINDPRPRI